MNRTHKRFWASALSSLVLLSCAARTPAETSRTEFVLGTSCTLRLMEGGNEGTLDAVFARLREIEARMSANRGDSEIAAVNAAAGSGKPVRVSPDTASVISRALEYARMTDGAFDPTVGPLVRLWNIGSGTGSVPGAAALARAKELVDWKLVEVDEAAGTVRLGRPGMLLDLGAIAKGYAADECARILAEHKTRAAIIDLGGNIMVFGRKRDRTPWKIGVQDPESDRGEYMGLVSGFSLTVVTSGIYERFFEEGGKRYHHILDTGSGFPVENGLKSVTVVAQNSMDADALSTSVFALGAERGLALVAGLPGVEAILLDRENRVRISPGASKLFRLTDPSYRIVD